MEVKAELTRPTVLALYDPEAPTKVLADASSFGLGAVLLQQMNDAWRPVVYASRSLTDTERRYAQIEKEALAVTWACEKFANYVLGCKFQIETDHKPLVPILSTKHLDNLPPWVLRFRLRLARFDYTIQHVPGKLLYTADALSRAPITATEAPLDQSDEVETFIESVTSNLPASTPWLEAYRKAPKGKTLIANKCRGTVKRVGQRSALLIPTLCHTGRLEHHSPYTKTYCCSTTASLSLKCFKEKRWKRSMRAIREFSGASCGSGLLCGGQASPIRSPRWYRAVQCVLENLASGGNH